MNNNPNYYFGVDQIMDEAMEENLQYQQMTPSQRRRVQYERENDRAFMEYVNQRDQSGLTSALISRGHIPASYQSLQEENYYRPYESESEFFGGEGTIAAKLNEEYLSDLLKSLQDLDEVRQATNKRVTDQLHEKIDRNKITISEIDEAIRSASDNPRQLNMLNQQKIQLLLQNLEYYEIIDTSIIDSDTARIMDINEVLIRTERSRNPHLYERLINSVSEELNDLQENINTYDRDLNIINTDKEELIKKLQTLQIEFESLAYLKIYRSDGSSSSSSKVARYN